MSIRRVSACGLWILPAILMLPQPAIAGPYLPSGLVAGELYQLMFVTHGERDATSSNISDYNAFVNAEAALNPTWTGTDFGLQWFAIASTPSVDARDNALVQAPVYLLNGQKFSDGFADMWDGTATGVRPNIDQFGAVRSFAGPWAWTGTNIDGTAHLGGLSSMTSEPWAGRYDSLFSDWIIWGHFGATLDFPLYALSQTIKAQAPPPVPVPEPAGMFALATGIAVFLRACRARRARLDGSWDVDPPPSQHTTRQEISK